MENNDTKILIDNDDSKRSVATKDDSVDSDQVFFARLRHYNRQGPHIVYGSTTLETDRKKAKPTQRVIRKSGKYNISRDSKSEIWDKYLRDFSHTLVNSRWRWTIIASTSSFILSWLLFGLIWMLIANANGDVDLKSPSSAPCLSGIRGFAGYFLFSLESQATIGYGSRYISHHCPEAVFILCLQIIMGCAICGLMVNIVYLKLMKPLKKHSKRMFSKHAVICRRDGDLCLIFRVRDEDAKHAVSTVVNAYILRKEKASEVPCLETLSIEPHGFLIWPLEIVHKITRTSPLWDISSYDLITDRFELIVELQGTSPTTGQCTKTRTSYLSSEILWGHRFTRCVKYSLIERAYVISHKDFNETQEHTLHLCSAKRVAEVFRNIDQANTPDPSGSFPPKRIEINIVHSNRVTYRPAQSIEKLEQVDKKVEGESSEKRRSQYEGVATPDEDEGETAKLLPKFNFADVTLAESSTSLVRPSPADVSPGYDNASLVPPEPSLVDLIRSPPSSVELSPGYDNVSLETDRENNIGKFETQSKDHNVDVSPGFDEVLRVGGVASKYGSHQIFPRNNSLTLALPAMPKSNHYHAKEAPAPSSVDEVPPEIAGAADVSKFGSRRGIPLFPPVPKSNRSPSSVDEVPLEMATVPKSTRYQHSSHSSLSSSGLSNLSTKANVSSEEIMDLDAILAYLEEYLEKNGA